MTRLLSNAMGVALMAALACSMLPTSALAATADVSYGGGDAIDTKVGIRLTAKEIQMSIDAPVRITIEGADHAAIDIDKMGADGASSGKVTFVNRSERAAYLAGAEVIQSEQANVGRVFQGSVGSDANPFMKIVAGATTGQVSTVDPNAGSTPMDFDISSFYSGGRRDFYLGEATSGTGTPATFDLSFDVSTGKARTDLGEGSLKGNTTDIASVIWTFGAVPIEPAFEATGQEADDFFLSVSDTLSYEDPYKRLEPYKGKTFSLDEVATAAECLSRYEDASLYYGIFNIMCGPASSSYTCKTTWDAQYDVRVIGILHDDLSDGAGKAGVTFQFNGILNGNYRMNSTNTGTGGWGRSEVRDRMNPGSNMEANGETTNTDMADSELDDIWNLVPADLAGRIKQVKKAYGAVFDSKQPDVSISNDYLFILSQAELTSNVYQANIYPWKYNEGSVYAFWRGKVPNNYSANPTAASANSWRERSLLPESWCSTGVFLIVGSNGDPTCTYQGQADSWTSGRYGKLGIRPAFCL